MKALSTILVTFLVLFSLSISTQSNIGGGYEMNMKEKVNAEAEKVIDYNYSEIPADEMYGDWDTHNIHAYSFNKYQLKDTLSLVMVHDSCDFVLPHEGYITSLFGNRKEGYHHGIDIKLNKGEKVKAAFEGMVRISQYSNSYGHVVVIRHNSGIETLYAHLSKRNVKPGDHVEAGSLVGLGGNTGRSSGAHLHFETRYKGEPINPSKIVDFKNGVIKEDTIFLAKNNFKSSKNEAKFRPKVYIQSNDSIDPEKVNEKAMVTTKITRVSREDVLVEEYTNDVTLKAVTSKEAKVEDVKVKEAEVKKTEVKKTEVKETKVKETPVVKTEKAPVANTPKVTPKETDNSPERRYHRVVKDDTIYSLARTNGVTVDEIKSWNKIGSNNLIKIGRNIRVH